MQLPLKDDSQSPSSVEDKPRVISTEIPKLLELGSADQKRTDKQLSKDTFLELVGLLRKYNWLEKRDAPLFDLWDACDNRDQQELLKRLFDRFVYIGSDKIEADCEAIKNYIVAQWNPSPSTTRIVAAAERSESDGSHPLLYRLRGLFDDSWDHDKFINTITNLKAKIAGVNLVIVVDDFTGTGTTASRKLAQVRKEIASTTIGGESCKLGFVSMAGMEEAKNTLEEIGIPFYIHNYHKKGISSQSPPAEVSAELAQMLALEAKLASSWKGRNISQYSLGFGQAEALYAADGWTIPNNVFPIFWWPFIQEKKNLYRRMQPD